MRFAVVLAASAAGLVAAWPARAGEMRTDEAKRFIAGKLYSFRCFEGTAGAGRVQHDGSVVGVIRFGGAGAVRYVTLPAGTLRVKGQYWCAALKGISFEPCFDLVKVDDYSFRGNVTGLSFAYCNFTRRARSDFIRTSSSPATVRPASSPATVGSAATEQKAANSE
jgi:hypothetical protein